MRDEERWYYVLLTENQNSCERWFAAQLKTCQVVHLTRTQTTNNIIPNSYTIETMSTYSIDNKNGPFQRIHTSFPSAAT